MIPGERGRAGGGPGAIKAADSSSRDTDRVDWPAVEARAKSVAECGDAVD